ncbi:site-specific integrase [Xanthobacter sp.]|uniref:tyrosine-type recombinase/integrase n=1 Tax=Xanthobacter sp. TaxID=35809 RepID=UPI0025E2220A|nr:site-specific integrase [Xanthobacter sp.]
MAEQHDLMGGRLHLYKRGDGKFWQCSTYLGGRNHRASTKEESLSHAKDFAEDWYLELRGKQRRGELKNEKTFKQASEQFLHEYEIITQGERNAQYVKGHGINLRVHLLPFLGDKGLSEITPGLVQEYRIHRSKTSKTGKPPARSTLHHEVVTLRQVLKTANRHGWLQFLPDLSPPYKTSGKVGHRAWFSPTEYRTLYMATRKRAQQPLNNRWKHVCEQLHDYVLFMGNTGLRPDEAGRLQYRDVKVVRDRDSDETILEIEVRGKRGVGFCKSTTGAVRPFMRLRKRNKPKPEDLIFPGGAQRELFNTILDEEGLKFDRDGNRRTAYSLRHTYICIRLMEGADIYQIAKNCRTSVEMIEKYYAVHLKTTLDASAINVRKPKIKRETPRVLTAEDA